jgi:hypothetical protein
VHAGGARHLRQAHDRRLDLLRAGDHEVGQLVDDDDDEGQLRQVEVGGLGVVLVEVLDPDLAHHLVAPLHVGHRAEQDAGRVARVRHHRADQVRHAVEGA